MTPALKWRCTLLAGRLEAPSVVLGWPDGRLVAMSRWGGIQLVSRDGQLQRTVESGRNIMGSGSGAPGMTFFGEVGLDGPDLEPSQGRARVIGLALDDVGSGGGPANLGGLVPRNQIQVAGPVAIVVLGV